MRGIFATGVLDQFLSVGFNPFHLAIGVSAGATTAASWVAGMAGRSYRVFTEFSSGKEFINPWRFLRGGHLMDLDWLWDTSIRELPYDLNAYEESPVTFLVGVTRVADGTPHYVQPTRENIADVLKASSAMPLFYRSSVELTLPDSEAAPTTSPVREAFADGGLSDPIPVEEAYRRGAERILVVRSRPRDYEMRPSRQMKMVARSLRKKPALQHTLLDRPQRYNRTIQFIRNPPAGVHIIEVNPPTDFETSRTTRDPAALERDYQRGREAGAAAITRWNGQ